MKTNSLVSKFWGNVAGTPDRTAMFVKHPSRTGEMVQANWRTAGGAVALLMEYLLAQGFKKGDRAAILAWNCPDWVWADLAIQSLGGVTVSIYPNCSAEQVNYVVKDSGATLIFSDDEAQLAKVESDIVKLNFNTLVSGTSLQSKALSLSYDVLRTMLKRAAAKRVITKPHDVATLIYSSGSTGIPKGCVISHGNIAGALTALGDAGFKLTADADTYLSYLPLAHVYERINGMALCIWNAVPVAFSTVDNVRHDIQAVKPTMLCGVPAVWRKIKAGIDDPKDAFPKTLNKLGLWQPLLRWALARKGGIGKKIADKVVLDKIRARMGGRLKLLVSGGAPIAPELLRFFNDLGMELLEGYGATETTGGITTNRPSAPKSAVARNKVGSVGQVLPGCEIRLVAEEGEENAEVKEIWLRGPQVFSGYWNRPDLTADALTADGWYKTGDLGRLDEDGFLFISGRKDGMYKTDGGKYVAKEKIEKAFEAHPIIQCVVPVAHGRKFTSALVFINQVAARALVSRPVPEGAEAIEFLSRAPAVVAAVEKAVSAANAGLESWEKVKKHVIMPIEAQVANGLLTPTLKIRSKEALKRFAREIEEIYATPKQ